MRQFCWWPIGSPLPPPKTDGGSWIGRWPEIGTFLAAGIGITIELEHLATISTHPGWSWRYSKFMPVVPVIGIGLSPLAQWLLLAPLALWLVRRRLEGRGL